MMLRLPLLLSISAALTNAQNAPPRLNKPSALISASAFTGGAASADSYLNADSPRSALSDDGRFVLFQSDAADVVSDARDGNFGPDVFVHDRLQGKTMLASATIDGIGGPGMFTSVAADFSAGGRFLVFRSTAPDLAFNDFNQLDDIFVRDLQAAKTTLVSRNRLGGSGAGRSLTADISGDGRVIAFDSDAPDLVAGDRNNAFDVFVFAVRAQPPSRVVNSESHADGKERPASP
jgi:hypothetical protein